MPYVTIPFSFGTATKVVVVRYDGVGVEMTAAAASLLQSMIRADGRGLDLATLNQEDHKSLAAIRRDLGIKTKRVSRSSRTFIRLAEQVACVDQRNTEAA